VQPSRKRYKGAEGGDPAHGAVITSFEEHPDGTATVILAPQYEHLLKGVGANDPVLVVAWSDANVRHTLDNFNAAAAGGPPAPPWMALPPGAAAYNEQIFKSNLMSHVHGNVAGGSVGELHDNAIIAPNDFVGYSNLTILMYSIGSDPSFNAHAVCPVGRVYAIADGKQKSRAVRSPIPVPAGGVGAFE
jgi:hypothetical protein